MNMEANWTFKVEFDGGTLPGGDGYGSWRVEWNGFVKESRREKFLQSGVGHRVTNNVAEWLALKGALVWLRSLKSHRAESTVEIGGDSQLVIRQLTGRYKCRNSNMRDLRDGCLHYLGGLKGWSAKWRGRHESVRLFGH